MLPFLKDLVASAAGDVIAIGNTAAFDIRIYDGYGQLVRIIRRADPLRETDAASRREWLDGQLSEIEDPVERNRRRVHYEQVDFPATMPAFASLMVADGGRLWVQEYVPGAAPSDETRWTVYDRRGRRLGEATMPPGFRPGEIGEDYVLGVWRDDVDVEYVRLYDLALPESL